MEINIISLTLGMAAGIFLCWLLFLIKNRNAMVKLQHLQQETAQLKELLQEEIHKYKEAQSEKQQWFGQAKSHEARCLFLEDSVQNIKKQFEIEQSKNEAMIEEKLVVAPENSTVTSLLEMHK